MIIYNLGLPYGLLVITPNGDKGVCASLLLLFNKLLELLLEGDRKLSLDEVLIVKLEKSS